MTYLLHIFLLIPFLGFLISLAIPQNKEKLISQVASITVGMHFCFTIIYLIYWVFSGFNLLDIKDLIIFKTEHYEYYIDFCFDKITAVYLFVGSFLVFLVTFYSKVYLHREPGYKRFFNNILFFYLGYNITIFSGNLETLFVGWEILGISSFLLIAFYRDRYLPVKNALKVFSIYRIGDIGIILAMWICHHIWHENIKFLDFENFTLVESQILSQPNMSLFFSIMVLVAALAKSAQFPFSAWLPRAMEGPTPSSAIFYGSLTVHIGVFVLLKTMPFWQHQIIIKVLIGVIGLLTCVTGTTISHVQSSVKSQIAYSSIAQIGIIFIEVAFGFTNLALFHFAGNAFLRTYQLLVSPSVVSYLIREQIYNPNLRSKKFIDYLPKKWKYTIYMYSLKEYNMDLIFDAIFNNPIKKAENRLKFISMKAIYINLIPIYIFFVIYYYFHLNQNYISTRFLPVAFSAIALVLTLKSLTERKRVENSWILIIMNHFWILLAMFYNTDLSTKEALWYIGGVVIAAIGGFVCLRIMKKVEKNINLDRFRGHSYEHPTLAIAFFIFCLGLAGFPITTTFIGEDILFNHIKESQITLATFISISFILNGLAIIRLFALVFLGPHSKTYHQLAYKSS